MHARVTFLKILGDNLEEVARRFEEAVAVTHEREQGFRGAILLTRRNGTALAINLADSPEDIQANDREGLYQAEVARFRELIHGHPRREFFDVSVAVGLDLPGERA